MYGLIIAGGAGTRLWPLSRASNPKQLLSVMGGETSLLQDTFSRLSGTVGAERIFTVTGLLYRDRILAQLRSLAPGLPEGNVLAEPFGRDSAPAVLWGVMRIADEDPDAVVAVVWSDHLIRNGDTFQAALTRGVSVVSEGALLSIGVTPTKADTGLGYIKLGEPLSDGVYRADKFIEKPDLQTARKFLESGGYAWNAGIFVFHAQTLIDEFQALAPGTIRPFLENREKLAESGWRDGPLIESIYGQLEKGSLDYQILEKTKKLKVMSCDLGWSDLGAWDILYRESPKDEQGNSVTGNVVTLDTHNSMIRAESRLVTLVGMDNVIVVDTDDALLICNMERVQDVKRLVEMLRERGAHEVDQSSWTERPWGRYHVLAQGQGYQLKTIEVMPGQKLSLQMHHHRAEHWVVIEGEMQVELDGEQRILGVNDYIHIPLEAKHRMGNTGSQPATLVELQVGAYLGEDDIVRFEDIYGRT